MNELLLGAQTLLKTAYSTWTPAIVMRDDLEYWPEGDVTKLLAKLPAIFIKPIITTPQGIDDETEITLQDVETEHEFRVVIVDKFDTPNDDVTLKRITAAEDVANRFLSTTALDMGATISGFRFFHVFPQRLDYKPPEDNIVAQDKDRQLFAVAVDVMVKGRADR